MSYKRGKSWVIDIELGGERINRKGGSTKKEADALEADLKSAYRRKRLNLEAIKGDYVPVLFGVLAVDYFEHAKLTKHPRTYDMEKSYYSVHLSTCLNGKLFDQINNELLLTLQGHLKKSLANRSVNICIGIVRKIINHAVTKKAVEKPVLKYPLLRESKKLHAFLTFDEYERLSKSPEGGMIVKRIIVGRNTGMRPAELAYLTTHDLDFENRTIKIQGKKGIWQPKTNEERLIPMNETTFNVLKDLCQEKRKGPWIFSKRKQPIVDIGKSLANAARAAEIARNVTPNMLRHTFATHALMKGADLKSVQTLMGHADIETTAKYLHSIREYEQKAVNLLEDKNCPDKLPTSGKKKSRSKTGSNRCVSKKAGDGI